MGHLNAQLLIFIFRCISCFSTKLYNATSIAQFLVSDVNDLVKGNDLECSSSLHKYIIKCCME